MNNLRLSVEALRQPTEVPQTFLGSQPGKDLEEKLIMGINCSDSIAAKPGPHHAGAVPRPHIAMADSNLNLNGIPDLCRHLEQHLLQIESA